MKSSSLKMIREHGIKDPRAYRDSLIHDWYLEENITDKLKVFMQRIENTIYLKHLLSEGELKVGQYAYQVIWIHKPATVNKHGLALLSFRYCSMLNTGYVLIKKAEGDVSDIPVLQYDNNEGVR